MKCCTYIRGQHLLSGSCGFKVHKIGTGYEIDNDLMTMLLLPFFSFTALFVAVAANTFIGYKFKLESKKFMVSYPLELKRL